jgi:hypothetical protein
VCAALACAAPVKVPWRAADGWRRRPRGRCWCRSLGSIRRTAPTREPGPGPRIASRCESERGAAADARLRRGPESAEPPSLGFLCQRNGKSGAPPAGRLVLVRSGDEISGDAGYRSPSESARRSFLPSAPRGCAPIRQATPPRWRNRLPEHVAYQPLGLAGHSACWEAVEMAGCRRALVGRRRWERVRPPDAGTVVGCRVKESLGAGYAGAAGPSRITARTWSTDSASHGNSTSHHVAPAAT